MERVRREMQAKLDAEMNRTAMWKRESEGSKKALAATKGQLTKIKKCVNNGVCPICHRNFVALGRHMKGQHPDFCEEAQ